nr:hypothetical protein CRG98_001885 [Ipomoea batatas]
MSSRLWKPNRNLEAIVIGDLLHKAVDLVLRRGKRSAPSHGALHELGLDLHIHKLPLELASHDGVEAGSEAEVVHLLAALPDGVLGVDSSAVHVSLLDGLLHLQLLGFLLFLALPGLALETLGRELQLHDLIHQFLCVPHDCFDGSGIQVRRGIEGIYQLATRTPEMITDLASIGDHFLSPFLDLLFQLLGVHVFQRLNAAAGINGQGETPVEVAAASLHAAFFFFVSYVFHFLAPRGPCCYVHCHQTPSFSIIFMLARK